MPSTRLAPETVLSGPSRQPSQDRSPFPTQLISPIRLPPSVLRAEALHPLFRCSLRLNEIPDNKLTAYQKIEMRIYPEGVSTVGNGFICSDQRIPSEVRILSARYLFG